MLKLTQLHLTSTESHQAPPCSLPGPEEGGWRGRGAWASSWGAPHSRGLPRLHPHPTPQELVSPISRPPPAFSGRREAGRSLPGSVGWRWAPLFLLHHSPNVGVRSPGLLVRDVEEREMPVFIVWGENVSYPLAGQQLFCLGNGSSVCEAGSLRRKGAELLRGHCRGPWGEAWAGPWSPVALVSLRDFLIGLWRLTAPQGQVAEVQSWRPGARHT